MRKKIIRVSLISVLSIFVLSLIAFAIADLRRHSYVDRYTAQLRAQGEAISQDGLMEFRQLSGLESPVYTRYWQWLTSLGRPPVPEPAPEVQRSAGAQQAGHEPAPVQTSTSPIGGPDPSTMASPYRANHMIVKNAELELLMEDVPTGVDGVTQVVVDTLGYILSSRTWLQDDHQYATMTIGVPVHEFERTMRRLRGMATKVLDETASGKDVTDQYVDLESRLRNLEATEARVRSFLEQAINVEESLRINAQLAEITAQIEKAKGQMSYLRDRAAYSTITVHLVPQVPPPVPEPDLWRPGKTLGRAAKVLGSILQAVSDTLIWIVVILGPFAAPAALLYWLARWLGQRKRKAE
jgi:uncharacterized coiled-coil protein SlyX